MRGQSVSLPRPGSRGYRLDEYVGRSPARLRRAPTGWSSRSDCTASTHGLPAPSCAAPGGDVHRQVLSRPLDHHHLDGPSGAEQLVPPSVMRPHLSCASYLAGLMAPEHTNVEVIDESRTWWDGLDIRDQRAVAKVVDALVRRGHRLRFPHRPPSRARGTAACGCFASPAAGRSACFTPRDRRRAPSRRRAGRPEAMSGHHPWSELTKHFTPEDGRSSRPTRPRSSPTATGVNVKWSGLPARAASLRKAAPPRRRHRIPQLSVRTGRASVTPVRFAEVGRAGEKLDHPAVLGRVVVPSRRPGGRRRP